MKHIRGYWYGLGISVATALIVVLTAIDVQSGRVLDQEGHGWSFALLFGPEVFGGLSRQGWQVVTSAGQIINDGLVTFQTLFRAHMIMDSVFIVTYAILLWALVTAVCRTKGWLALGRVALAGVVLADVVENAAAVSAIYSGTGLGLITAATKVKWCAVGALLVLLVLSLITSRPQSSRATGRRALRRGVRAVVHQRFSYLPVVTIFVLSVLSGAAILEQLPDAQRRWLSDGSTGLRHATLAMLSTLALAAFLFVVARFRTGYARRHLQTGIPCPAVMAAPVAAGNREDVEAEDRDPVRWVWFVGPGIAIAGALLATLSDAEGVIVPRLLTFLSIPVGLVLLGSLITKLVWHYKPDWSRPDRPQLFDPAELFAVSFAGNVAAISAVVVGGLSLLRAFTPLVVLPSEATGTTGSPVWWLLGIGGASVLLPWCVAIVATRRLSAGRVGGLAEAARRGPSSADAKDTIHWGRALLLFAAIGVFLSLGLFPGAAAWIGLSATATLALGALAGTLSAVGLILQDRPTAEIFRFLRFRRSPLVSILVLALVAVSLAGGSASIHDVDRGAPGSTTDSRQTLGEAFGTWVAAPNGCEVRVGAADSAYRVRPMLMVAAEGGGVRAAYWTVRSLQAIEDTTCGEYSALFSAGASGGSVGLTVSRFTGTAAQSERPADLQAVKASGADAVRAVKLMARSENLSEAADGTFIRDIAYGASGVPIPRPTAVQPWEWIDRARLIEQGWAGAHAEGQPDWGDLPFLSVSDRLPPSTGHLILNSTSVKNGCRVWISQLRQDRVATSPETASFDPEKSCDKNPGPAARTVDLFSAYGPYVRGATPGSCLGMIRGATAALLTARFPYVTPSGVVGPCPQTPEINGKSMPHWPRTQLVDGGYIENTGLATITDLSDDWLALVREHNAAALAAPGRSVPLVVPIVVFLNNGDRNVTQPALNTPPTSELAVPIATFLKGKSSLTNNDALLERARSAVELAGFCPSRLGSSCAALDRQFPSRVVVVDRLTKPEIAPPLGWVLSEASITAMEKAMQAQVATTCEANRPQVPGARTPRIGAAADRQPSCRVGYATLGDLVRYYQASTP
ncbi:MAG TPA: hypothetical protein VFP89_15585 [Propionibacteriaceae bacterium]|nr:hypothetical protein [Propionibacteriaceae bacterium]